MSSRTHRMSLATVIVHKSRLYAFSEVRMQ